jgi:diguanylate cyclase (GGDEF)-like protein/PAS domain S-box-containing protein
MITVLYTCVVEAHDLRLVGLAAIVCSLAAFTAINLLKHVGRTIGSMRHVWLGVAAVSTGFGIWATHFIAMLAFSPGLPTGYNVFLTVMSLFAAMLLTGVGLGVALSSSLRGGRWLGGAIVGGGIAAMHYTGMAAFEVAGRIVWDPALVAVSIALGGLIGAAALPAGLRDGSLKATAVGALLLTLAICSHHFTAMAAAMIVPDPSLAVSEWAIPTTWLAAGVALASFTILLLALTGLALDLRERHRAELETDRMRGLANAAVEGLLVCDGDAIVTVNSSFAALSGVSQDAAAGRDLRNLLPGEAIDRLFRDRSGATIETMLRHLDGTDIPVEIVQRPVDFAGKGHTAVAVRDLRDRKKAEEHIRFLAMHDTLTGLPNRAAFEARLEQEIETHLMTGRHLAVLCLDLDRFKEVNDLFGHAAGDKLLQTVARCVGDVLGGRQMMARLGGDEFAVIAPDLGDPAQAGVLAERIFEAMRTENERAEASALLSTSIGIATLPGDAMDRTALLNHADTALYRAKADGRGAYRFFEATMGAQVRERRLLEHDLRHAVSRRELRLVYQPQARIDKQEVVGFEALLRWRHAQRGDVPPSTFIAIAEETGQILQIGEWVLRTACREAAGWAKPLSVAVNVSAMQLHHAGFAELVHEVLWETGLKPHRLELEITETALIRDLARALSTLRRLKALGVRIAMDDFGTGYSSLSNLRAFPFDKIKIDGSFIRSVDVNAQAATIVRAVLGLGRGLGLPVLAEGVESEAELAFLHSELCNEAQGYLLGRPGPIESFRHMFESGSRIDHAVAAA